MYHDLLQGMGTISALNALATGWIHPKLDQLYIQNGQHIYIPTLDSRWMRITPTHPTHSLELRWIEAPPTVVKKRSLFQISLVDGDAYLTINKLCHAKVYHTGTTTPVNDVNWNIACSSEDYLRSWSNRLLINGKAHRVLEPLT